MATHYTAPANYTDEEMLAFVQQALIEVEVNGSSYAVPGGRQWTSASYPELQKREAMLLTRISLATRGRVVNYVEFARR